MLAKPPKNFDQLQLPTKEVDVERLRRVSGFTSGEPYFGTKKLYRFDDPKRTFGTCYCGLDLDTAVAESVLRDAVPQSGRFEIAQSQLESKHVVRFAPNTAGDKLILSNLTGAGLKRLGADNSISSVMQYAQTQKWAAAVHAHPTGVDGILFVSRQLNDKKAVVLFDRAKSKLGKASYAKLSDAKELESTKKRLGIKVVY